MANRPAALKQSDLTRYVKAVQNAGVPVGRIVIKGDTVTVYPTAQADEEDGPNPCDRLLK